MSTCSEYQALISQMLDGELPEPQKTGLLEHIGSCKTCASVYDAFAFISSSLDEGLADPPADFGADVMQAIQKQDNIVPISAKKQRHRWTRPASLVACMALIVLLAYKGPGLSEKSGANAPSDHTDPKVAYYARSEDNLGADAALNDTDEPDEGLGGSATQFGSVSENEPVAGPSLAAAGEGINEAAAAGEPYAVGQRSPQVQLLGVTQISVLSGGAEQEEEPIITFTDEATLMFIMDLLEFSESGDQLGVSGDPVFTLVVTSDENGVYQLDVYIIEGRLCCRSSLDDTLYIAAGDVGDLFDLIANA